MSENYFTFPLAALHGQKGHGEITPFSCIDLALSCAMLNAAIGFRINSSDDEFIERLDQIIEEHKITWKLGPDTDRARILIGAEICGVKLGGHSQCHLDSIAAKARSVKEGGAFVRLAGRFFWPALKQARAELNPKHDYPERGISWREFRVLCAILSVKRNRANFSYIGWETIQHRSCGYTNKAAFLNTESIPDHLAPPLTRKKIRDTCDNLENLGFFARFRLSTGKVGGRMAYSFRHTRDELAQAVCESVNFNDGVKIRENRAKDAANCLKLLERAKSRPNHDQQRGQVGGQVGGQHNEKSPQ